MDNEDLSAGGIGRYGIGMDEGHWISSRLIGWWRSDHNIALAEVKGFGPYTHMDVIVIND